MRSLALAATLCATLATPALAQNRFPSLTAEQMTPEQRALAAAIQGGPRAAVPRTGQ